MRAGRRLAAVLLTAGCNNIDLESVEYGKCTEADAWSGLIVTFEGSLPSTEIELLVLLEDGDVDWSCDLATLDCPPPVWHLVDEVRRDLHVWVEVCDFEPCEGLFTVTVSERRYSLHTGPDEAAIVLLSDGQIVFSDVFVPTYDEGRQPNGPGCGYFEWERVTVELATN